MTFPNSKPDWKAIAATFLRVACGGLLVYASYDKLGDSARFSNIVAEYHALPAALVPLAAVVVPWLEFFTGACLMAGFRWRGAAFVFCVLMAVYSLALGWNLAHGVEMNCGCFSMDSTEKVTWWTIGRDLLFLGMGLLVLTASHTYAALDRLLRREAGS